MKASKRGSADLAKSIAAISTSSVKASKRGGPASRVKVEECPHVDGKPGLCGVCGWQGHRVPRAWLEERPGTPYPGKSRLVGARVRLRGDDRDSTVTGVATPLGGTLFGKNSKRRQCEGSYVVATPFGRGAIETVVPKSVVRERRREREGNCPDAGNYNAAALRAAVAEIERDFARDQKRAKPVWDHPFAMVGFELPFPHRKGSTACCAWSPVSPEKLRGLVERYRADGEEQDFETARVAVRRALPEPLRSTAELESTADLLRGIRDVEDHCWGMWLAADERAKATSKSFKRRAAELAKERERLGLGRGTRASRRMFVEGAELSSALASLDGDASFDVAELEAGR
jgi:hypothetical protein